MNIVTQVLLPLILAFIMFSMGLSLRVSDFTDVVKKPKAFAVGFFLQLFTLPLIGFTMAWVWTRHFGLDPVYGVGLMIIASCPGGVTSNLMTHLVKGDTALSISLTAITSIVSVFTLPLFVNIGLRTFLNATEDTQLNVFKAIIGIFLITTVPVLIGMTVKHLKESFADKIEPTCRKAASLIFVLIILAAIVKDFGTLSASVWTIAPSALTLNIITMLVAIAIANLVRITDAQEKAITLECGLQNGTLAIFVAATLLNNTQMVLPGVVYGLLMFFSGGVYMAIVRNR